MTTVIDVEHISKVYFINHKQKESAGALKNRFGNFMNHSSQSMENNSREEFWALDDISFSIEKGQRVGIIGRNGSGKSTLLKILSRITQPTSGRARIHGRVASLLEVGTGFHPELTGRENIFLNGAVLGMRREEVRKKFDAIVTFAEIDKFLDTPVKRYSSGMYVRLAFSVAAHLEPEILIIDEVLAVGDASFKTKCLKKMKTIGDRDTTILFVSHSINFVRELCDTVLLLDNGKLIKHGPCDIVINEYSKNINTAAFEALSERKDRQGNGDLTFNSFITTKNNKPDAHFLIGEDVKLTITLKRNIIYPPASLKVGVGINDDFGQRVTCIYHEFKHMQLSKDETDISIEFIIKNISLVPGEYRIVLFCMTNHEITDLVEDVARITVSESQHRKEGVLSIKKNQGLFLLDYDANIN